MTPTQSPPGLAEMRDLPMLLTEAAEWLADDIPAGTREIADLEGDVRLDELDLYCVRLMQEASDALAAAEESNDSLLDRLSQAKAERDEARAVVGDLYRGMTDGLPRVERDAALSHARTLLTKETS